MEPQADIDKGIFTFFLLENTPVGPGVGEVHGYCIVCSLFGNLCVTYTESKTNRRLSFYALSSIQLVV